MKKRVGEERKRFKSVYINFPLILLIAFALLFSIVCDDFLTIKNIKHIFLDNTYVFIFCVGYAFILTGGGLDFSAGMQITLVSSMIGVLPYLGAPWPVVLVCGIGTGLLCGALNAYLVSRIHVPYAFATLATSVVFYGLSYMISQGKAYWVSPDGIRAFILYRFLWIPMDVWILALCLGLMVVLINHTYIGAHIIAVGERARSARLSGVNIHAIRAFTLILGSLLFAVSAFVYLSKTGVSSVVNASNFFQITGFPAAYLAVSAAGEHGRLNKSRTLLLRFICGVCAMLVLDNGFELLGIGSEVQYVFTGIVIILAEIQDYKNRKDSDRNQVV